MKQLILILLMTISAFAAGGVAVLPFTAADKGEDYGLEISDHLMSFLAQSAFVTVVDRNSVAKIMQEIEFGMTGMVDEATAVEAGKLVGAEKIVVGSYTTSNGFFKINARIVDVATGVVTGATIKEGKKASEVMDMAAVALLDQLGIKATYNSSYKVKRGVGFASLGVAAATLGAGIYSQLQFTDLQEQEKTEVDPGKLRELQEDLTFHKNARFYFWGTSAVTAGLGAIMLITADSEWTFEKKNTKVAIAPFWFGETVGATVRVAF